MGLSNSISNVWDEAFQESTLAARTRGLLNIGPNAVFDINGDLQRQFRLTARRAGLPASEVLDWETQATKALTASAPEEAFKAIVQNFDTTVWRSKTSKYGMSNTSADELLKHLGTKGGAERSETFGAVNNIRTSVEGNSYISREVGAAPIERPIGSSQLVNQIPHVDPIVMDHFLSQYVGTTRSLRNTLYRTLRKEVPSLNPADLKLLFNRRITLPYLLDRSVGTVGRTLLKVFKLGAVARPAYIFRVVLGDELLRSVATTQSAWEVAMSHGKGGWDIPLAGIIDNPEGVSIGQRSVRGVALERPGALPREALANTMSDQTDLLAESLKIENRRSVVLDRSGEWGLTKPTDPLHSANWSRALNEQIARAPGLSEGLQAIVSGKVKNLDELRQHLLGWSRTPEGKLEMQRLGRAGREEEWADIASGVDWSYTMGGDRDLANLAAHREVTAAHLDAKFPKTTIVDGQQVYGRPYVHGPKIAEAARGGRT
jgi:hypothetical protein